MEPKWHQMEVPNCSKIKSKWRAIERATERSEGASEWVVANCHAVSCMQRTCSISIEIFLKLWASKKKKSLWKLSQSNQHKIFGVYRASRSLSRQVSKTCFWLEPEHTFRANSMSKFGLWFWIHFVGSKVLFWEVFLEHLELSCGLLVLFFDVLNLFCNF